MKIIIEGVDRIGKTTLANKLIEKYNCDYLHFTRHDPRDFEFYSQTMRKENVIHDRHFIGEMIYPEVFNRKNELSVVDFYRLFAKSKDENVLIIVMYTSDLAILDQRMDTEEYEEIRQQYKIINEKFMDYAKSFPLYIIGFDVSKF